MTAMFEEDVTRLYGWELVPAGRLAWSRASACLSDELGWPGELVRCGPACAARALKAERGADAGPAAPQAPP